MEPSNHKKKPKEQINGANPEFNEVGPRIKSLSSYDLNNFIKNLSHPKFLGSLHLKKEAMTTYNHTVENMVKGELEMKMNKSLKNTFLNPITLSLIFIAIIFNIAWIMFLYL
jgi:hypothetical protein